MISEVVKQQLRQCKIADIPAIDDNTYQYHIPRKSDSTGVMVKEGGCYLIELADYILHPYDGFDLHKNWNNNIVPSCKHYKCECIKLMGKFMKINGVGYDYDHNIDLSIVWSGWLPLDGIKILGEV